MTTTTVVGPQTVFGPQTIVAQKTHEEKYQLPGEGFEGAMRRVAKGLADSPLHEKLLLEILLDQRFLPAGRVQSSIGSPKQTTAYNCFVSGTIEDTFVSGSGSIMHRAMEAATTMRSGGGIGYNWGTLRPKGSPIKKLMSKSSGPVAFMHINDAICRATSSAGNRRGAQMGVMPIWHPDIEEFIDAKKPPKEAQPIIEMMDHWKQEVLEAEARGEKQRQAEATEQFNRWFMALQSTLRLTGFNLSVGVTDEFMHALAAGETFKLRWGGKTYREVDAQELWEKIMRSTWDWAEPGVLFLDTINRDNNLWYCEYIWATNPCAEQPLPPFGACLLGSWNLVKYLVTRTDGSFYIDNERLAQDIRVVVRAMDNVVDRTVYPLAEQEREAQSKRRMGLGVTGLANALEICGFAYGSPAFIAETENILKVLAHKTYEASIELAREKGAFPMLDAEKYLQSGFCKRALNDDLRDKIRKYGIRNSHLLSIAPTGTISLTADNVSSGIEPVFAYTQKRLINFNGGQQVVDLHDWAFAKYGVRGRKADSLTAQEHLGVLKAAYRWVDSAVSKTCNVSPQMPWDEFKRFYVDAWEGGCKGLTTFNKGGRRAGILRDMDDEQPSACTFDPATGRKSCE